MNDQERAQLFATITEMQAQQLVQEILLMQTFKALSSQAEEPATWLRDRARIVKISADSAAAAIGPSSTAQALAEAVRDAGSRISVELRKLT